MHVETIIKETTKLISDHGCKQISCLLYTIERQPQID